MTRAQLRVLAFVAGFVDRHGFSPSLTEIAAGIGMATSSRGAVSAHVSQLVSRGYLCREPGSWTRNLQVTEPGHVAIAAAGPSPLLDLAAVPTSVLVAELGRRAHG